MYRFLKHKVRHLDYLLKDLDSGNVCPACPQVCHEIPPFLCTLNTVCIHNDYCIATYTCLEVTWNFVAKPEGHK